MREAVDVEAVDTVGEVEVDERFFGENEANRHADKKPRAGCCTVDKEAALGTRKFQGLMAANPTDDNTALMIQREITDRVQEGATLHYNGHRAYDGCENL